MLAASSRPLTVSAVATGASFTGVTVREKLEEADLLPSVIVTVTTGAEPFQFAAGVKV